MRISVKGSGNYLSRGLEALSRKHEIVEDGELLVCLAHPEILKPAQIALYPFGAINFHAGLPRYRGRHPLQWMLIDGVTEIPIAVHYIDEGIDTGDIIVEDSLAVDQNETYASALDKVLGAMGPMLMRAAALIVSGAPARKKQGPGRVVPRRTPADSAIDWMKSPAEIHRFINAMSDPMPNAFAGNIRFKRSIAANGEYTFIVAQ